VVHIDLIVRVWGVGNILVTFVGFISSISRSLVDVISIFIRCWIIAITMIQLLDMNRSRPIAISRFSGSLVDIVAIFIRCWVISMIRLLDMNRSRPVAISRLSRPLSISMVVGFRMINLDLVVRIWSADILVAFTSSAISSLSRSLFVVMINFISIRSMVGFSVLVDIGMPMTVAVSSRSFTITSISLNSLGTSVVVAYS